MGAVVGVDGIDLSGYTIRLRIESLSVATEVISWMEQEMFLIFGSQDLRKELERDPV